MSAGGRGSLGIGSYLVAARVGVGIAFVAPFLWFIARHWWTYRTTDGLAEVLAAGMITGVVETVEYALTNPVQSLLYSVGVYLLWIFALGHRH